MEAGEGAHKPFQEKLISREMKPGECVHTDVCGPIQVKSQEGAIYFVSFIDKASSVCHVYFMKGRIERYSKALER